MNKINELIKWSNELNELMSELLKWIQWSNKWMN